MKKVVADSASLEKAVKENLGIPDFLMMENAACALENAVLAHTPTSVFIACGKGNNGADGLALARKLHGKTEVHVYCPIPPVTKEGTAQFNMAQKLGCCFVTKYSGEDLFVDCVFGTGFHGLIDSETAKLFESIKKDCICIACDVPSGLAKDGTVSEGTFKACETVTMGTMKLSLLSDQAKDYTGKITVAELGLSEKNFCCAGQNNPSENHLNHNIFLVEEDDVKLPFRNQENTHKGKYGHVTVFAGSKSGAAVLSATSAVQCGAGLVTIFESDISNLSQFQIDPSLMTGKTVPKTSSTFVIGSGLGRQKDGINTDIILESFETAFMASEKPAAVLDADIFYTEEFPSILERLNKKENSRIILTPHAKELSYLAEKLNLFDSPLSPSEALKNRIKIGLSFTTRYENAALVMKGANTFCAVKGETFISTRGGACLSKAGSGDVLGGVLASLLAQGYSLKDTCITGPFMFGMAAENFGKNRFDLTALKLCSELGKL